ncbi:MAG: L,D-transpeptidase family protein [Pseudomonadota bacterium]
MRKPSSNNILWFLILLFSFYYSIFSLESYAAEPLQDNFRAAVNQANFTGKTLQFYQKVNFRPIWFDGANWNHCAKEAIDRLAHAEREGLEPNDYRHILQNALNAFEKGNFVKAELHLTKAFLRYIDDVRNGRFNPRLADRQLVVKPDPVDAVKILYQGSQNQTCGWMNDLAPHYFEYMALKLLLAQYRQLAAVGPWPTLATNVKLVPGETNSTVRTLREILVRLGDLSSAHQNFESFDDTLRNALLAFQERHGLEVDGKIGPKTLKALNTTPQQRIQQITIAMERWRWMPRDPGERYIRVNIPEFALEAVENRRVVLKSKIIIGMTYRETPVFTVNIRAVRFNPSWHIPRGIFVHDKLPKILKDPSYIRKRGYVVTNSSGRRVNPSSVNWSSGAHGYRLRQTPGPKNALGKIRFTMPNRFNVYLHDTSQKQLFDKPVRTFSSGCIRVQKPVELALFVFNDPIHWGRSVIESEMKGYKTRNVTLSSKVPVHVTYFTTWVDEQKRPHFVADIYGQDRQVWNVLRRSHKK